MLISSMTHKITLCGTLEIPGFLENPLAGGLMKVKTMAIKLQIYTLYQQNIMSHRKCTPRQNLEHIMTNYCLKGTKHAVTSLCKVHSR